MVGSHGLLHKDQKDIELNQCEAAHKWQLCQITNAESLEGNIPEALKSAAVVATDHSNFPNQVNNSLGFPGIFRGALEVRAKTITDEMCLAAATALADIAVAKGLTADYILPTMGELEVHPREAAAVAAKAVEQDLARLPITYDEAFRRAEVIHQRSRAITQTMLAGGYISSGRIKDKPANPEPDARPKRASGLNPE